VEKDKKIAAKTLLTAKNDYRNGMLPRATTSLGAWDDMLINSRLFTWRLIHMPAKSSSVGYDLPERPGQRSMHMENSATASG